MSDSPVVIEKLIDLTGGRAAGVPEVKTVSREGPTWIGPGLTEIERQNVEVIRRFWEIWKTVPYDPSALRDLLTEDAVVRIGWRGDHVCNGREAAMAAFAPEVERQTQYGETASFKFPVLIAKGPVVFHTWTWISESQRLGYRFERPMAAIFLFRGSKIERWDSYATGKESAPGYAGSGGPDGL